MTETTTTSAQRPDSQSTDSGFESLTPQTSTTPPVEQSAPPALPPARPVAPPAAGPAVFPRPHIERVIDGDEVTYQLDLRPIGHALVRDIAHALTARNVMWRLRFVVGLPLLDEFRSMHERIVLDALSAHGALIQPLHEDDVEALLADCTEALEEPPQCDRDACTALAVTGDTRCSEHWGGTW